jgi:hypothetical protein
MFSLPVKKKKEEDSSPSFLGLKNEAVRDSEASAQCIHIEVRGIKGLAGGSYRLAYSIGSPLKHYLDRLKLRHGATRAAIYDYTNLEHGRCRMHYIPENGARIVIGPPSYGPAYQWQRGDHDAGKLMEQMGGGARFVDKPI